MFSKLGNYLAYLFKPKTVSAATTTKKTTPKSTSNRTQDPRRVLAHQSAALARTFGPQIKRDAFEQIQLGGLLKQIGGVGGGGGGGGVATYKAPKKPKPKIPTLSLDEMMDIINRRVGLMIDPQIEALRRGLEEERLAHERRVGDVGASYEKAREQLRKTGQQQQREGASSMRKRGLYDSGIALDLANRIQRQISGRQAELESEQARALSELADYLALRERQIGDEIKEFEGQRGQWSQSLLDEMQQQERSRKDSLEQQAFENWLAEQAMQHQIWQSNQAARAAAARSGGAPRAPTFKDILDQAMMQTFVTMPGQQQRQYIMSQMFPQQQMSYGDQLDQMRLQALRRMGPEQVLQYLFPGVSTPSDFMP